LYYPAKKIVFSVYINIYDNEPLLLRILLYWLLQYLQSHGMVEETLY